MDAGPGPGADTAKAGGSIDGMADAAGTLACGAGVEGAATITMAAGSTAVGAGSAVGVAGLPLRASTGRDAGGVVGGFAAVVATGAVTAAPATKTGGEAPSGGGGAVSSAGCFAVVATTAGAVAVTTGWPGAAAAIVVVGRVVAVTPAISGLIDRAATRPAGDATTATAGVLGSTAIGLAETDARAGAAAAAAAGAIDVIAAGAGAAPAIGMAGSGFSDWTATPPPPPPDNCAIASPIALANWPTGAAAAAKTAPDTFGAATAIPAVNMESCCIRFRFAELSGAIIHSDQQISGHADTAAFAA